MARILLSTLAQLKDMLLEKNNHDHQGEMT